MPHVSSKEQHRPKATIDLVLLGILGVEDGRPKISMAGGNGLVGDCFGLSLRLL